MHTGEKDHYGLRLYREQSRTVREFGINGGVISSSVRETHVQYSDANPAARIDDSLGLLSGTTRDQGRCFDPDTEIVGSESEMTMGHTF